MPWPFSDSWNTCAVPWKPVVIVAGRLESRSMLDRVTASPSAKPGARLNEIVTAGCWPWWLTSSGPTDGTGTVTADSGIDCPDGMPLPVTPEPAPPAPAGGGRRAVGLDEDLRQARRIGAELGRGLEDDLIVVARRIDRRDLARAEGVEQLLADLIDGDAVDRRLLAVDLDRHLRIGDVEVGGDVEQAGNFAILSRSSGAIL